MDRDLTARHERPEAVAGTGAIARARLRVPAYMRPVDVDGENLVATARARRELPERE